MAVTSGRIGWVLALAALASAGCKLVSQTGSGSGGSSGSGSASGSGSGSTGGSGSSGAGGPGVASGTFSGTYVDGSGACVPASGTITGAQVAFVYEASVGADYSTITVTALPAAEGGGVGGAGLTTVTSPAGLTASLNITFCIAGAPAVGTYTQATTANEAGLVDLTLLGPSGGDGFQAESTGSGACAGTGGATEGTYTLTLTSVTPYSADGYTVQGTLSETATDTLQGGPGCSMALDLTFTASSTGGGSSSGGGTGGGSSGGSSGGGTAGVWDQSNWDNATWQ
jgi:hypothetical protein